MKYTDAYIKSDAFLDTFEWRKVRMEAILKYGKRCQCCGAVPQADNRVMIHVDHIIPRKVDTSKALDLDNLQILCNFCNHGKGNWDTTDWRTFEPEETSQEYFPNHELVQESTTEATGVVIPPATTKYMAYDINIMRVVRNFAVRSKCKNRVELGLVISNLFVSVAQGVGITYSRSAGNSSVPCRRKISNHKVMSAINILEEKGLLVNIIGRGSREKKFRQSSVIFPTERFKEVFEKYIKDEEFMLKVQQDWEKAQDEIKSRPIKTKPKKTVKKTVTKPLKNNLKVKKEVMKELLAVMNTWR